MKPHHYLIKFMYRREPSVPAYLDECVVMRAYTAEDALTQLRIAEQAKLELRILSIEPCEGPLPGSVREM